MTRPEQSNSSTKKKGFGFISTPDGDIFLHVSALELAGVSRLGVGQEVSFDTCEHRGRVSACDIEVIDAEKANEGRRLMETVFR
jgi:CspA family cold shock protein